MNINPKAQLYREEANFFFNLIKKKINKNSKILDVGAGPGFLVEKLILEGFPNILGIDKISKGFTENYLIQKKFLKKIKKNKNFFFTTIEKFESKKKFDTIFLFSVLEHVENWEKLLLKCIMRLKKNGKLIVNCPNYSSFYEPHFGLPIIINKKLTYFFFKKKINELEKKNNYHGLYQELNFITYNKLTLFFKKNGMNSIFDKKILKKYFLRINKDKLFKKRHPYLGKIVNFLNKIKLTKLFFYLPMRFQPILQFEIKKISKINLC